MDIPPFVCSAKKAEEVNKALKIVQARRKASKEANIKKQKLHHNASFAQNKHVFGLREHMFAPREHMFAHREHMLAPPRPHPGHFGDNANPHARALPYDTCRLCGKQGHWMKSCPLNKQPGRA